MQIEFIPLLQIQRDLHNLPRGFDRFRAYLKTMIGDATDDISLAPLVSMNPMGKDHVPPLLDAYLQMDADGLAARVAFAAAARLAQVTDVFKLALVVTDDAVGGWTNRYFTEFNHCFATQALHKRGWLSGLLWTSAMPTAQGVREAVLTTIYRAAYIHQHGFAVTLRAMLAQEGYALALAGCTPSPKGDIPTLPDDELAYTREVIAPHLNAKDQPTLMACLFGDAPADSVGYPTLGLSDRAGFALALHDGRQRWAKELMA